MVLFLIETGKYVNIVLAGLYCLLAFISLGRRDEDGRNGIFHVLEVITLILLISGTSCLALAHSHAGDYVAMRNVIMLGAAEAAGIFAFARLMYHFYPEMNRLLFADMEFMLCIGFVVLMRLNFSHALRQYIIIVAGFVISMFIPMLIHRLKLIRKTGWICGAAGGAALLIVYIHGSITNGAKLSMKIFGLTFQPSEVIKILFAFFIAGILYKSANFLRIVIAAACASVLILILTVSRDLGMALIYAVMFIAMIYMASGKIRYVLIGLGAGSGAAVAAYNLFSHVRVRFNVWKDPWTDIDNTGYQLTQSLFAIGTGNWFGLGIGRGKPTTIPDVEDDFIFSAIAEESGLIFGIILILVCLNLLIAMLLMVGRVRDNFFRIAGMGMAVCYGIQTVLTIGGGTMFIPLTGVTLPLVSNGGSSVMTTLLLFAVLQGISLIRMDEIYEGAGAVSEPAHDKPEKNSKSLKKEKAVKKEKPEKKEKEIKSKEKVKEKAGKQKPVREPRVGRRRVGRNEDMAVIDEDVTGAAIDAPDAVSEAAGTIGAAVNDGAFAADTGIANVYENDENYFERYTEKDPEYEEYDEGEEAREYESEYENDPEYDDDESIEELYDDDEESFGDDDDYNEAEYDEEDNGEYSSGLDRHTGTDFPDEDYADEIIDSHKKY